MRKKQGTVLFCPEEGGVMGWLSMIRDQEINGWLDFVFLIFLLMCNCDMDFTA